MRRNFSFSGSALAGVACLLFGSLWSCGIIGSGNVKQPEFEEVPAHLRAGQGDSGPPIVRTTMSGGQTVEEAVLAQTGAQSMGASGFARSEDIVWTNADDPYAKIPELDKLLSVREVKKDWQDSYTEAKREAAKEGLPLMLWFTNSARSPRCRALSEEVLATPTFEQWSKDHLRRVRLDFNLDDSNEDLYVKQKNYLEGLKKRFGVHGFPTVVMVGTDGQTVAKYRGYKPGGAEFYIGRIKLAVEQSKARHATWRADLEKKGYRTWRNKEGREVFARVTGYREKTLTLVEPDGRRSRTTIDKLAESDQIWVENRLRGEAKSEKNS